MLAASSGSSVLVNILLEAGADVNAQDNVSTTNVHIIELVDFMSRDDPVLHIHNICVFTNTGLMLSITFSGILNT